VHCEEDGNCEVQPAGDVGHVMIPKGSLNAAERAA
jgi:hypothetical protein